MVLVSPADMCPISQVSSLPSISTPPVAIMFSCDGISLETTTSFSETPETFSTSSSINNGPPSPPLETDSERSWSRSGLVSSLSLRTSMRLFLTLYLVENSLRDSNSSTWTWSPARFVLVVLFSITSIS